MAAHSVVQSYAIVGRNICSYHIQNLLIIASHNRAMVAMTKVVMIQNFTFSEMKDNFPMQKLHEEMGLDH